MKYISNDQNPYSWLRIEDGGHTWILRNRTDSPIGVQKLMWNEPMSDGSLLTDLRHTHLLETIQEVVIRMRLGDSRGARQRGESTIHQYQIARALMALTRWMLRRGTGRFSHLTPSDFNDYTVNVRGGAVALDDPISRLGKLATQYLRDGRTPPMRRHGKREHLHRSAFLIEAGLPSRSNSPMISYELSRIEFDVFKLPKVFSNKDAQARYEQGPPEQTNLTMEALLKYLTCWEVLWQYRDALPDPLQFHPFEEISVTTLARDLGEEADRTPNIPPRIALGILDLSIRWVLHYGPDLLALRDELMAAEPMIRDRHQDSSTRAKRRTEIIQRHETVATCGPGDPWPLAPTTFIGDRAAEEGQLGLNRALNTYLAAACFIVISTFSARRHMEVATLREHPEPLAPYTGNPGRRYLTVWIEKTRRQWDQVPVPEIIVLAVELLRRLSATARARSEQDLLFQFLTWTGEQAMFDGGRHVPEFAAWLQQQGPIPSVPVQERPEPWRLTPHQLRRFFALTYFHHWENADLGALSWILRHNSLEMTLRYCMEKIQGEATTRQTIKAVQHERTVDILTEIVTEERVAGGGFANRFIGEIQHELDAELERLREALGESVTVLGTHQVRPIIDKWATQYGIELSPTEHIECTCRPTVEDSRVAPCRQPELLLKGFLVQLGPNRGLAKPSVCGPCPHGLILGHHAPCFRRHETSLEAEAESPRTPPLLAASSREELAKVKQVIKANAQVFQEARYASR